MIKISIKYNNPISITNSSIIKARAFKESQIESDLVEQSFYIINSKKNGLNYEYYEGNWGDIPNFEELTPKSKGRVYAIGFEGINKRHESFAVRYRGYIQIDQAGDYTFHLNSNDGSQLFINDILVVDNGGSHGLQQRQGNISLQSGLNKIEIHYFDSGGSQGLEGFYQGPGFIRQIISSNKLFAKN